MTEPKTVSPPDMSIGQTAEYLGINERTVRNAIADGRLTAYQLGPRVVRLRRSEVDAALRSTRSNGGP